MAAPAEEGIRDRLLDEISLMLGYALEEGLPLDPKVPSLVGGAGSSLQDVLATQPMTSLVELHGLLVKTVAPATPGSLRATIPGVGSLGFLRHPPIIGWMVLASAVFALGFAVAVAKNQHTPTWWSVPMGWVSGAGLGSAFYALFTAHDYVKQRTFDPRYNSVYMIRFVLGMISGIILAHLPIASQDAMLKDLSQDVIALLGGYSAEAVNQVLQRLVDILVAAVNGSGTDATKAKVDEAEAKGEALLASAKLSVNQELATILSSPAVPDAVRTELQKLQSTLK